MFNGCDVQLFILDPLLMHSKKKVANKMNRKVVLIKI
jgi:hypothetical protein